MDLEWDVELAAFLGGLEEQGVAQGATGEARVFAALGANARRAEGNTEGIGVHRLELEGRAVGADGFHADGAALNVGSQHGADRAQPFARLLGVANEVLGEGLQPDDLPLRDADCLLLFWQGEGLGGGKTVVDEHDAGRGSRQQAPSVAGCVGGIAVREDGGFARLAVKLARDPADGVLVGDRVDDVAFGQLGIERFGECPAQLDGR